MPIGRYGAAHFGSTDSDQARRRHHGIDGYAESGTDREPNRDAGSVSDKTADRCAESGTDGDECFTLKPPLGSLFRQPPLPLSQERLPRRPCTRVVKAVEADRKRDQGEDGRQPRIAGVALGVVGHIEPPQDQRRREVDEAADDPDDSRPSFLGGSSLLH